MSERDEILKQLEPHSPLWVKILRAEFKSLETERDRLQMKIEAMDAYQDKLKAEMEERLTNAFNSRDAWKSQCERLTEALGIASRAESLIKNIDKELCMDCGIWKAKAEHLAVYEALAGRMEIERNEYKSKYESLDHEYTLLKIKAERAEFEGKKEHTRPCNWLLGVGACTCGFGDRTGVVEAEQLYSGQCRHKIPIGQRCQGCSR